MTTFPMLLRLAGRQVARLADAVGRATATRRSGMFAARGAAAATGAIALVGAGPGAADLLTLRALHLMRQADVIFYDRLVDPGVLDLARPGAEKVFVGKEVGANAWPQERINAMIVAAARRGRRVVRLKSGDPGIFGRLADEAEAARKAGIPLQIVPGVTAASAAAASLGRGLTERGATDRLMLATAACRPGDPAPDWAAMLRPGTSLAVYMGVRQAPAIVQALRDALVPMSLEVEIVSKASTPDEKVTRCPLGALARVLKHERVGSPAVILIRWPKEAHLQLSSVAAA